MQAYVFFDRDGLDRFVVVVASSSREALGIAAEDGIHIGSDDFGWDMMEAEKVL